jgi:ankyrin repeat protein
VASHIESFKDLNSLVRTSHLFHGMFNRHLYRRAVAADRRVLDDIVGWVLGRFRLDSLTLLLDNGLSVNHTGEFGFYGSEKTMLRFLCRQVYTQERATPLARLLIQRGTDLEVKDENSETVIFAAIRCHNCDAAAPLLAQGADPNAVDRRGDNPVVLAAKLQDARLVNLLVAQGADINGRDRDGNTPLIVATLWRKYDIIPVLLAHGADAGAHNNLGMTPLHCVCRWFDCSSHHELVKSLLAHGALVNAADNCGNTALHWAVSWSRPYGLFMVRFLLENGADVNALSKDGSSPLHRPLRDAFPGAYEEVFELLLEHGADVGVLDQKERNQVFQICQERAERMSIRHAHAAL